MVRIFMLQPRLLDKTDTHGLDSLTEHPFLPMDKKNISSAKTNSGIYEVIL